VILTTKGIDDLCMKYFIEAGAMAVRRVKPADMKKIAKATGAHVVVTMADMEGDEVFEEKWLGQADEVQTTRRHDITTTPSWPTSHAFRYLVDI
jgi:T-complex protein 1 subunit alpha